MECITSVYQSTDGRIFQGIGAANECRQYEIAMSLRGIKARLNEIGYAEEDVSDTYNAIFPYRHGGRLYRAKPRTADEYKGFLDYVFFTAGEPRELTEARKLTPVFPVDMSVVVHKGSKHPHATILQKEIADGLRDKAEPVVEMISLQSTALVPVGNHGEVTSVRRGRCTMITFNGITKTITGWAKEIGISYRALQSRLVRMSIERALTMPYAPRKMKIPT